MSQQTAQAAAPAATAAAPAAPYSAAEEILERPSVVLATKILSAVGNAIFAFGLVGVVASVMH